MSFLVEYLQDIPKDCGECPCSIHITPKEVYCNARQKHFEVTNKRPDECKIIECDKENPNKTCKTCIFNCGKTFYIDHIICGYVNSKGSIYKLENETCNNWISKGETNAKLD